VTVFLPFFCALLAAGYATRAYGAHHYDDPQIYTASILLIYASPYGLPQPLQNLFVKENYSSAQAI
jgi:hypothetical protein